MIRRFDEKSLFVGEPPMTQTKCVESQAFKSSADFFGTHCSYWPIAEILTAFGEKNRQGRGGQLIGDDINISSIRSNLRGFNS
jgi:hypothetical protein